MGILYQVLLGPRFKQRFGNTLQREVVISVLQPGKLCNDFDFIMLACYFFDNSRQTLHLGFLCCLWAVTETDLLFNANIMQTAARQWKVCLQPEQGWMQSFPVGIYHFRCCWRIHVEFSFFNCLLKSHTKSNLISYIHGRWYSIL